MNAQIAFSSGRRGTTIVVDEVSIVYQIIILKKVI